MPQTEPAIDPAAALTRLNAIDPGPLRAMLLGACGSVRWAELVAARRPYEDEPALSQAAETAFDALRPGDWREAFAAHARIGAPRRGDAQGTGEQAGVAGAAPAQQRALEAGNDAYEARFGHVFLIRAAGRGTEEVLAALRTRLRNSPERELELAAEQQRQITAIRLRELLHR